jgi:hypothetical protein
MNRHSLYQGRLDGLCGIYSIVNALRIINNLNINEAERIFIDLTSHLHKKEALFEAMTNGLFFKDMKELITSDVVKPYCLEQKFPFVGKKNPTLPDYWAELSGYLNNDQNDRTAVIIGLSGKHDHWTVVRTISKTSLYLQDSSWLKRLNRKNCTTATPSGHRQHILKPAQTCFLRGRA